MVAVVCAVWLSVNSGCDQASLPQQNAFADLTTEQVSEIQQQRKRFEELPEIEQQRRRELHRQMQEHPDSERLYATMDQFHDWLTTLRTSEFRGLLEIEGHQQQVARIRELRAEQESKIFGLSGDSALPKRDLVSLNAWTEKFVYSKVESIRQSVRESQRRQVARVPERGQPWYYYYYFGRDVAQLNDIENLAMNLSGEAQSILDSCESDQEKLQLGKVWIRQAVLAKIRPAVTDARLHEYYRQLQPEVRNQFDDLNPREWRRRLERHYYRNYSFE